MTGGLEPMERYLAACLTERTITPDGRRFTARLEFPDDLQGPPGAGHGGAVSAAVMLAAGALLQRRGEGVRHLLPLTTTMALHRELPLEVPVEVEAALDPAAGDRGPCRVAFRRGDVISVEGVALAGPQPLPVADPDVAAECLRRAGDRFVLPGVEYCLACGLKNPRGLRLRFDCNDEFVWKRLSPPPHFGAGEGTLGPAFAHIVLDEIGWWVGALRFGECGVTNHLVVTLLAPLPAGRPLLVVARRADVEPMDRKGRIWKGRAQIADEGGEPLALAEVVFAGSRAFSKAMMPAFLAGSEAAEVRRVFPQHVP